MNASSAHGQASKAEPCSLAKVPHLIRRGQKMILGIVAYLPKPGKRTTMIRQKEEKYQKYIHKRERKGIEAFTG